MSKLLERTVDAATERLVLLAPDGKLPSAFGRVETDPGFRSRLLHDMQRMRGRVYVEDGAVNPRELTADGRHHTAQDDRGWHILTLDGQGQVAGCAWFLEHGPNVEPGDLRIRHCPLGRQVGWRARLRKAVGREIGRARQQGLGYVEVGGWAVSKVGHIATDGLLLALAGYGLGRLHGGVLGLTTATVRHCSSTILRRIGGSGLEADGVAIPSYFDPQYQCEMEILQFDSRMPNPRYERLIERLSERLSDVLVLTASDPSRVPAARGQAWSETLGGFSESPSIALAS